jgi:hypothetical protein
LITFYRLNSYDYFLYFGGEGIDCGEEYYKQGAKSNLKVCDECIEKNEFRAPPLSKYISCDTNEPAIDYNPDKKQKKLKIEHLKENQQIISKSSTMDLFEVDSAKEQADAQEKQNRIAEKNKETYNNVNRIILALLPETPNQEQDSKIAKKLESILMSGILDPPCIGCKTFKEQYILSEPSHQKPERTQEQNIQQTNICSLRKMDFCGKKDSCGELCRKLECYKCMDYLFVRYSSEELRDLIFIPSPNQ